MICSSFVFFPKIIHLYFKLVVIIIDILIAIWVATYYSLKAR